MSNSRKLTSAANTEVVTAYEELELTISEISAAFDYEEEAVKAILLSYSSKYRDSLAIHAKNGDVHPDDVTDDEFRKINEAYIKLALYSDNDTVREKALRQLRDEKRKRLPAQQKTRGDSLKNVQVNILQFNELLKAQKHLVMYTGMGGQEPTPSDGIMPNTPQKVNGKGNGTNGHFHFAAHANMIDAEDISDSGDEEIVI